MPRGSTVVSIDGIIREVIEGVVARASEAIAREVAAQVSIGLRSSVVNGRRRNGRTVKRSSRPRQEITRWVADNRARRVPNFVIDLTGLKTKKKVVAKYGPGATFEKGKPTPKPQ